jgi:hypothetical protein
MTHRIFTLADQIAFAELSGDNNPLHVDPVAARRSLFGQPIVHGVHALMWALDQWLEGQTTPMRFQQLRVAFLKQIGLNQEVRFTLVSEQNNRVRIDLFKENEIAVRMVFEWLADAPGRFDEVSPVLPEQHPPDFLDAKDIQSCHGFLDLYLQPETARRLFPNLTRLLCPVQFAILLGMTRLVGVKCPGLQSIFSELNLTGGETDDLQKIKYAVSEFDDRYGLVLMAIAAPGLRGTIRAFIRPQPQAQATFLDLKKLIKDGEFVGQRALIVGGSRGLGEVTAKLLAAGEAQVQVTYRMGKNDAQKVVDEIIGGGGQASACELDVLQPRNDWAGLTAPTHLYYFASPFISGSEDASFSSTQFNTFCSYYVNGFAGMVETLQKLGLRNVFYPSTVFIDEMPAKFLEYAIAKNAGEVLCQAFEKKYPEIHFYYPRLPKMATDQTVSFHPAQNADPASIILAALQNFRDSAVSKNDRFVQLGLPMKK